MNEKLCQVLAAWHSFFENKRREQRDSTDKL